MVERAAHDVPRLGPLREGVAQLLEVEAGVAEEAGVLAGGHRADDVLGQVGERDEVGVLRADRIEGGSPAATSGRQVKAGRERDGGARRAASRSAREIERRLHGPGCRLAQRPGERRGGRRGARLGCGASARRAQRDREGAASAP